MFDIKLKDGRYFTNVDITTEIMGIEDNIETILDHAYTEEDGQIVNIEMEIYKHEDDNCTNLLASVTSNDIEYVSENYKYKKKENK